VQKPKRNLKQRNMGRRSPAPLFLERQKKRENVHLRFPRKTEPKDARPHRPDSRPEFLSREVPQHWVSWGFSDLEFHLPIMTECAEGTSSRAFGQITGGVVPSTIRPANSRFFSRKDELGLSRRPGEDASDTVPGNNLQLAQRI
jgi:hypothetical protein